VGGNEPAVEITLTSWGILENDGRVPNLSGSIRFGGTGHRKVAGCPLLLQKKNKKKN
jgi:hypothetical protein